jgi:hypothetical protein
MKHDAGDPSKDSYDVQLIQHPWFWGSCVYIISSERCTLYMSIVDTCTAKFIRVLVAEILLIVRSWSSDSRAILTPELILYELECDLIWTGMWSYMNWNVWIAMHQEFIRFKPTGNLLMYPEGTWASRNPSCGLRCWLHHKGSNSCSHQFSWSTEQKRGITEASLEQSPPSPPCNYGWEQRRFLPRRGLALGRSRSEHPRCLTDMWRSYGK